MGYGETGASTNLKKYGFKAHADTVAAIAKKIGTHQIIIGGHDWYAVTVKNNLTDNGRADMN